jgi:predicted NAD/FAD-dependent oxidoreductase
MRVVIVGAGMAGLAAARRLVDDGHEVTLFDKGRSPGGRLATRRIGEARLDHGAQFFTIRSDDFAAMVHPHLQSGLVFEWCRGFAAVSDGYPRYAVRGGMNAWAKALAVGLDVRCNSMVFAIRPGTTHSGAAWDVVLDDGTSMATDALILTCPLPQSYALLVSAEVAMAEELIRVDYDKTIALLMVLDSAPSIAEPGGLHSPTDSLSFVADNQRKGISDVPALTVHAAAGWSDRHWKDSNAQLITELTASAQPFVGNATILERQIKKWRFATPRTVWPEPCWVAAEAAGPLALAGDAFAGPRIEGAVLSGLAAAAALF